MTRRRALITGIQGQDGSYLAQLLMLKDYEVHGIVRDTKTGNMAALERLRRTYPVASLTLHSGDLRDHRRMASLLTEINPHEIYNLAAQSNVARSFVEPDLTHEINYVAMSHLLDAVLMHSPKARFFQSSSSEMFGLTPPPQNESSPLLPQSPYALAKAGAHVLVREARESRGLYAVSGISFNHESPRRPETFVTRKISRGVAAIVRGEMDVIRLGNIEAVRDWGYAPEFVEGMWRSLQPDEPDDYIFASGVGHSVREFIEFACERAGLDWQKHVEHDASLIRPHDVRATVGDTTKARDVLSWEATCHAPELARIMVEYDLSRSEDDDKLTDVPELATWR